MTARVRVYTSPLCGYCAAAKRMLADKGVAFEEIDVNNDRERRREMEALSGRYTVPQIFINEQGIGGFDDMAALEASGQLDALLISRQPED